MSLIFLTLEIRQNTVAVESETNQGLQNQIVAVYELMLDEFVLDAVIAGLNDPDSMSDQQLYAFIGFYTAVLQAYQNFYFQTRSGAYDETLAEGWWQLLRNTFESPGMRRWWQTQKFVLSIEFRDFVENQVMQLEPTPPPYFRDITDTGLPP